MPPRPYSSSRSIARDLGSVERLLFATTSIELQTLARLTSIDFAELGSIGGSLRVSNAPVLRDLNGLSKLRSIGNALRMRDGP